MEHICQSKFHLLFEASSFVRVCTDCDGNGASTDSSVEGQRGWKRFYVTVARGTRALGDQ